MREVHMDQQVRIWFDRQSVVWIAKRSPHRPSDSRRGSSGWGDSLSTCLCVILLEDLGKGTCGEGGRAGVCGAKEKEDGAVETKCFWFANEPLIIPKLSLTRTRRGRQGASHLHENHLGATNFWFHEIDVFISATDPPLFLGVDACRDPGGSVLSRFSVSFWSVLATFGRNWPKIDQESTKSRPLARCSIGGWGLWGVTVCGWNKSVDHESPNGRQQERTPINRCHVALCCWFQECFRHARVCYGWQVWLNSWVDNLGTKFLGCNEAEKQWRNALFTERGEAFSEWRLW